MKRVIFLDIDGVLVTWDTLKKDTESGKEGRFNSFDPKAVERLNKIIEATDSEVVISSTWRMTPNKGDLFRHLRKEGIKTYKGRFDTTPVLDKERGHEIQKWLLQCHTHVDNFVILDDDSDMVHLIDKLVKTSMKDGLQDEHVIKALTILNS